MKHSTEQAIRSLSEKIKSFDAFFAILYMTKRNDVLTVFATNIQNAVECSLDEVIPCFSNCSFGLSIKKWRRNVP